MSSVFEPAPDTSNDLFTWAAPVGSTSVRGSTIGIGYSLIDVDSGEIVTARNYERVAITGSSHGDDLRAGSGRAPPGGAPDLVDGAGGDDTVRGGGAGDTLIGGAGWDLAKIYSPHIVLAMRENLVSPVTLFNGLTLFGIEQIEVIAEARDDVLDMTRLPMAPEGKRSFFIARGGDDTLNLDHASGDIVFDGADGLDTLTYNGSAATGPVTCSDTPNGLTIGAQVASGNYQQIIVFGTPSNSLVECFELRGSVYADELSTGGGYSYLSGGAGNDRFTELFGHTDLSRIDGGDGDDTWQAKFSRALKIDLRAAAADFIEIFGSAGVSIFSIEELDLELGDGADILDLTGLDAPSFFFGREQRLKLGGGDDRLSIDAHSGKVYADGGDGTDTVVLEFRASTAGAPTIDLNSGVIDAGGVYAELTNFEQAEIAGTDLDDVIRGRDVLRSLGDGARDLIFGGGGNDTLSGGQGADILVGGEGDDALDSGAGGDLLFGADFAPEGSFAPGSGDDVVDGGADDDGLWGGDGADLLDGGTGNDGIAGGSGDDSLDGGEGGDFLFGGDFSVLDGSRLPGSGADTAEGGGGDDGLYGFDGEDALKGGSGNDYVEAGEGDDLVDGGAGDDVLQGEAGSDEIAGGTGFDYLYGGAGADTFVFRQGDAADWALDFDASEGDRLLLAGFTAADGSPLTFSALQPLLLDFSTPGALATVIGFADPLTGIYDEIRLFGVAPSQLSQSNLLLA